MDINAVEGFPATLSFIMHSKFGNAYNARGGEKEPQAAFSGSKEDRMLMIIAPLVKRKIRMQSFAATAGGEVPRVLLEELDRWTGQNGEIYWIGKLDEMKNKVGPADDLTLVDKVQPPELLLKNLKERFPNHTVEVENLSDRLWKGLLRLDQFITNPMGITWLIGHDGGLELVKWTRSLEP